MSAPKVLFLGGTGILSSACADLAVRRGMELTVLNRGRTTLRPLPDQVRRLTADLRDHRAVEAALGAEEFDAVVNWVAFTPDHVRADLERFADRTGHYLFISSASAYQTPPARLPITESTPLRNPYWTYSRDKIACEDLVVAAYRDRGFPATIVRPSHTYDRTSPPLYGGWTVIERMRRGQPVVLPGDGTSLWTLTHARDFASGFVPLLGLGTRAAGEAFHITSDDVLTWNQIVEILARAAGARADVVHVPTDVIAEVDPEWGTQLRGDSAHSSVFDNTKIRRVVPGFVATVRLEEGAREVVAWHDADPGRRRVDPGLTATLDALVERHRGLRA